MRIYYFGFLKPFYKLSHVFLSFHLSKWQIHSFFLLTMLFEKFFYEKLLACCIVKLFYFLLEIWPTWKPLLPQDSAVRNVGISYIWEGQHQKGNYNKNNYTVLLLLQSTINPVDAIYQIIPWNLWSNTMPSQTVHPPGIYSIWKMS